jgi:hypothetical protein
MDTARRQYTDEFKREAVGLLVSSGRPFEPDCAGAGDCLFAGMVPGVERQPLKKLKPDENQLLKLMDQWRHDHEQGHGRAFMSVTAKTNIQSEEATGPRSPPNRPAPLAA